MAAKNQIRERVVAKMSETTSTIAPAIVKKPTPVGALARAAVGLPPIMGTTSKLVQPAPIAGNKRARLSATHALDDLAAVEMKRARAVATPGAPEMERARAVAAAPRALRGTKPTPRDSKGRVLSKRAAEKSENALDGAVERAAKKKSKAQRDERLSIILAERLAREPKSHPTAMPEHDASKRKPEKIAQPKPSKRERAERVEKARATRAAKPLVGGDKIDAKSLQICADVLKMIARASGTVGANRALAMVQKEIARRGGK